MDRTERFYKICQLLGRGRTVSTGAFLEKLEVSRATFYRDIEYLKDRFNAPIEYNRNGQGHRFAPGADRFELPGLWFTAREAHALLSMQQLLHAVQPGLLQPLLQPLFDRLEKQFGRIDTTLDEVRRRIRILSMAKREVEPNYFELISHAVISRKRLHIRYYNRERDETTAREVSPQRLVHYRDNWYLDAYDHLRSGLRTFALDCMRKVQLLDRKARAISDQRLDRKLGSSYGIFAGEANQLAVLRFNPFRARWVAREEWHPQQRGEWQPDNSFQLTIPYADDRELLMDILKFGPDVEVIAPKNLRARVRDVLQEACNRYEK